MSGPNMSLTCIWSNGGSTVHYKLVFLRWWVVQQSWHTHGTFIVWYHIAWCFAHLFIVKWLLTRWPAANADSNDSSPANTVPHINWANMDELSPGLPEEPLTPNIWIIIIITIKYIIIHVHAFYVSTISTFKQNAITQTSYMHVHNYIHVYMYMFLLLNMIIAEVRMFLHPRSLLLMKAWYN